MSAVLTSCRVIPAAVIPSLLVLLIVAPIASLGDFGQIASEIVYFKGYLAPKTKEGIAERERCWRRALELRTWRSAPDASYSGMANGLAILLEEQKRNEEAEYFYKKALQVSDETLGRRHVATSVILVNMGIFYCHTGRLLEAEHLLNQAMPIQLKELGKVHIRTSYAMKAIGMLNEYKGEYSKAKVFYVQALEIRKKVLEADNPKIADSSIDLARIYISEKRYAKAEPLIKDALVIRKKVFGQDAAETAKALYYLGVAYDWLGRKSEAEKLYLEAFRILKNAHEENGEYGVPLQKRLAISQQTR